MQKKYIMALDQGTTSSRCILFDKSGKICSMAQREFEQIYPKPGWVEHNPMEIWSSQLGVVTEALAKIGAGAEEIAALGITNQRETTIVWNRHTGEPVYNAIVWQCHRTADRIEQLVAEGLDAATIAQRLEQEKQRVCLVALVDTLEYLKRGGRLSKTAAIAGGLLNIKPVLSLRLGEITVLGKARGSKQGNNLLVCEMEKAGGVDFAYPILLGYTGLSDALLQKYMIDSEPLWQAYKDRLPTTIIGSVIGTHVGPGAVAVAFFKNV